MSKQNPQSVRCVDELASSMKRFVRHFIALAIGWIAITNGLLLAFVSEPQQLNWLHIGKDFVFVLLAGSLIWRSSQNCLATHKAKIVELEQSEESLVCVLAGSQLGFWDWNLETGEVKRNDIWAEMLGYSIDDIKFTTQQWTDFVHPDDRELACDSINAVLEGRMEEHQMMYRMRARDGSYKWVLDRARVVRRDAQGKAIRMSGTHSDVNKLKLTEDALKVSEERFRRIFEATGVGISEVGLDGRYLLVNDTFCQITGYSRDELLHDKQTFQAITHPDDIESNLLLLQQLSQGEIGRYDQEKRYVRKNGSIAWVKLSVALVRDTEGLPKHFIIAVQDITRLKELQRELELQAHTDYLTGLYNRRYFLDQAELELARALRYGNEVAIFMVDVDLFKQVNDDYGHKAGDFVLQKIARIMQSVLREVDILGRVGGEEFAVLLPQTSQHKALDVAERLKARVQDSPISLDNGLVIHITISIGVAMLGAKCLDLDALLQQADKGLYQAKQSGRNTVSLCA